jgi:MFS family permease
VSLQSASAPTTITLSSVWQAASGGARRNLIVLFVCQALTNGSIVSSTSLSSVIVLYLTGSDRLSGLPSALNLMASALAAFVSGRIMASYGRRVGLAMGYGVGAVGALLGAWMALSGNFVGFLVGGMLIGWCNGTVNQARYAAAEMVPASVRGRVIGTIVSGSVLGSLLATALTPTVQNLARTYNVQAEKLGWLMAAAFLFVGFALIAALFRPKASHLAADSVVSSRPVSGAGISSENVPNARTIQELLRLPELQLALVCLVVGQGVMTMLMVLTPVHLKHLGEGLPTISGVITVHIFGMFGFSWLTGQLVDRLGRRSVAMLGAAQLMLAGLIAVLAVGVLELGVALFLLGLGWNFCNVAGSALLADHLRPNERARTQGLADMLSWLSGAAGAFGGGLIINALGFSAVGWVGLIVGSVPLFAVLLTRPKVVQTV